MRQNLFRDIFTVLTAAIWIGSSCFAGITFWSSDSTLQFSNNSGFVILDTVLSVTNGTLERDPGTTITGFPINFVQGTYLSGSLDLLLTALYDFDEFYGLMLNGNKSFDALAGSFSGGILVSNQNNLIEGQPVFLNANAILLHDLNATLTIGIQNSLTTSLKLNGGTLFLKNNLQLANDVLITASGLIEAYGYAVTFGANPIIFPAGTIEWSHYPIVNLNGNVVLDGRWTFSGPAILNGNGNTLDFSNGTIRVDGAGPLYINNVKLTGLGTGKFEFEKNNSQIMFSNVEIQTNHNYTFTNCLTMTFQGVTLYLDHDFTLSCGHFEVIKSLDVLGTATFNYNTGKQSIIWDHSTMTIWGNATFNYMPPIANRDLIKFIDETSLFGLNGGTLASTTTGMRFLGGSFQLNNDCYLTNYGGAIHTSEGIQLGDGIDPINDCFITFITGANLNTLSGLFVYNNVY